MISMKKKKSNYKHILISNKVKPLNFLRNKKIMKRTKCIANKQQTNNVSLNWFCFIPVFFYSRTLISTAKTRYENSYNVDCITIKLTLYLGMLHNLFVFLLVYFSFRVFASLQYCLYVRNVCMFESECVCLCKCGFKRRIQ